MSILALIILVLFLLFVGGMAYILCYTAGEADDADEEIWGKMKEGKERHDGREGKENTG